MIRSRRGGAQVACAVLTAVVLAGCAAPGRHAGPGNERLRVVATTGILADLARNVAGERADVTQIVPDGADPHSYEPTLRDVRDVVYADVALSNYLLLEEHAVVRMLEANLPEAATDVSLAEASTKYAAEVIPLVENVNLDTVWLGLRVAGAGEELGATRASQVRVSATSVEGPGDLSGFLTETFGSPRAYFDSSDGIQAGERDSVTLPADAHTHMSWGFTEPGVYRLELAAELLPDELAAPVPLGRETFTFAVGVDPHAVAEGMAGTGGVRVLDAGHADLTASLDERELVIQADTTGRQPGPGGPDAEVPDAEGPPATADDHAPADHPHTHVLDPARTVISVPAKALAPVPAGHGFGFLGRAGDPVYLLPQAVLGKHVHGEIDPHLWHDVRNAKAYVQVIRDTLIDADPGGAREYRANAREYLALLDETDAYVAETIAAIPKPRRYLVTTHDAFAYLGRAYDVEIAGFVAPNPATEPSVADRVKLTRTIRSLEVPAVFLAPVVATRTSVLAEIAAENQVDVCPIWSDAFDDHVTTYVDMMRANADSLRRCLT